MSQPNFQPGQRISFLSNPESGKDPRWVSAEIEDVLSAQITFLRNGAIGYLLKSDFGSTWRLA